MPAVPLYGGHVVAARPVSPRPAPPAASPADLRQEGLWPVAVPHRPKCTSAQWARGGHWGPGHWITDMKQWVEDQHFKLWQWVEKGYHIRAAEKS